VIRLLLICLALLAPLAPASAEAGRPDCLRAVVVVDFAGTAGQYRLIRDNRRHPVAVFTPLRDGDRLAVTTPSGALFVQLADRSVRPLSARDGEQCVAQRRPTVISNARMRLGELLSLRRLGNWYGIGRGDGNSQGRFALALPDLAAGTARVRAGERRLALAWRGGEPPFTVEVIGPGARAIVHEERFYPRLLLLDAPRRIGSGAHLVRIRDARGAVAEGAFRAGNFLPAPPPPASSAEALVAAAALYEAGPGRSFDAFMLLSPFYQEGSTAGWMMALLTEPRPAESRLPR
jgi:hypothetical protein